MIRFDGGKEKKRQSGAMRAGEIVGWVG